MDKYEAARLGAKRVSVGHGRASMQSSTADRGLWGQRYILPTAVSAALERIFEESVGGVKVVEHSRYARAHLGMSATTRPNRILLANGGAEFIANPVMVLHEYFHVLRQWRTGYLTRWRYLFESMRRGYWENRFEREAREFSATALLRFREYLGDGGGVRRQPIVSLGDEVTQMIR